MIQGAYWIIDHASLYHPTRLSRLTHICAVNDIFTNYSLLIFPPVVMEILLLLFSTLWSGEDHIYIVCLGFPRMPNHSGHAQVVGSRQEYFLFLKHFHLIDPYTPTSWEKGGTCCSIRHTIFYPPIPLSLPYQVYVARCSTLPTSIRL